MVRTCRLFCTIWQACISNVPIIGKVHRFLLVLAAGRSCLQMVTVAVNGQKGFGRRRPMFNGFALDTSEFLLPLLLVMVVSLFLVLLRQLILMLSIVGGQ